MKIKNIHYPAQGRLLIGNSDREGDSKAKSFKLFFFFHQLGPTNHLVGIIPKVKKEENQL